MMRILLALAPLALAACLDTNNDGEVSPNEVGDAGRATLCLPKGIYLGEALGASYTDEQKGAIDALRMLNCPNLLELGYGPTPRPAAEEG